VGQAHCIGERCGNGQLMSRNDPIDESALADFERAKEIANRSKSLDEITAHLVSGIVDGEKLHRHIYWAMLYYSLLNNDWATYRATYMMVSQRKPELVKQFGALVQAQRRVQPKVELRTTPEEAAYCFKTAFEIGRDSKSEQEIRAAIPKIGSEVIRTKILVWACIYYCLTEGKPELYNSIKADFHELVSEFEYWCENLLVALEESKPLALSSRKVDRSGS
jgi:hypothetical protein